MSPRNPTRKVVELYLHSAGIEGGYGFFAPNVTDGYKLVFELHHQDGSVSVALPTIAGTASGVRLVGLLDHLYEIEDPELRALMVRMLASSVARDHSDLISMRAVFGIVTLPTRDAFLQGQRETYSTLFAYDLDFSTAAPPEP